MHLGIQRPHIYIQSQLNCMTDATKLCDDVLSAKLSDGDVVATECMYYKHFLTSMYTKYKQILAEQKEENCDCPYGRY